MTQAFNLSQFANNVNSAGVAQTGGGGTGVTTSTGSSNNVLSTSPTLTTPVINGFTGDTSVVNIGSGQFYKDASGNVGIGTASPASFDATGRKLVVGTGSGDQGMTIYSGTGNSNIFFASGTTGSQAYNGYIQYNQSSNAMLFGVNAGVERMRIDSSGNLLVGTTSGTNHIIQKSNANDLVLSIINSSATTPNGAKFNFSAAAPNNGTQTFWLANDTGGYRGGFLSNGGLQNYQANNSNLSDQREKKNIELAPNYLDKLCQIPVKTFLFNDQTDEDLNLGVIAQDIQAICPELVTESNWAGKDSPEKLRLSIYQTDLQYAMLKAIQELKAEFDAYKSTHP